MSRFAICSISSSGPCCARMSPWLTYSGLRARRHLCRAGSCVLRPLRSAANPRGNRRRRGRGGMPWARRPSTFPASPALFCVREKRSAVAVGVGVSVPTDLEGGVPLGKPADAKAEHLIVGFAHRAPPLGAPSARLALRGFRRTSFHQRRERVGAPLGWGRRRPACPSPSVMAGQARAGGYNASTRGVSWSSTMKEPSFSSLRSSHLARLRYVKRSVRVSLTSGQSTFSTVW